jgi:redox-sensitive bicupin YhaK (pirin superfamily)
MTIRVVAGEIEAKDATTRVALPTGSQPSWPPFERVAETIATARRPFPVHRHSGVEVLTYIIEGSASYELGSDAPRPLVAGSTVLLTAPAPVSHTVKPAAGHTVRWFSLVSTLPSGSSPPGRLQPGLADARRGSAEGTVVRRLLGPGTAITSAIGMEGVAIGFESAATSFQKVGHNRVAVCYALAGRGRLDNEVLEGGEAAFVNDAAGVALEGEAGFHVVFIHAPGSSSPIRQATPGA